VRRSSGAPPRPAARLAEKIEFDLLLTDLALEIGDSPVRLRKRVGRRRDNRHRLDQRRSCAMRLDCQRLRLGRPPTRAQRLRDLRRGTTATLIKILSPNPELAR
jgi:hypothetical protein